MFVKMTRNDSQLFDLMIIKQQTYFRSDDPGTFLGGEPEESARDFHLIRFNRVFI